MPLTKLRSVLTFKINGFLKYFLFLAVGTNCSRNNLEKLELAQPYTYVIRSFVLLPFPGELKFFIRGPALYSAKPTKITYAD